MKGDKHAYLPWKQVSNLPVGRTPRIGSDLHKKESPWNAIKQRISSTAHALMDRVAQRGLLRVCQLSSQVAGIARLFLSAGAASGPTTARSSILLGW